MAGRMRSSRRALIPTDSGLSMVLVMDPPFQATAQALRRILMRARSHVLTRRASAGHGSFVASVRALTPAPVRPHPLLRRLADKGFELGLQRRGGDDRVGLAVVGFRDRNGLDPDREAQVRLAES